MTQSKKSESTINIEELNLGDFMEDDTITIDLGNTMGTITTSWTGDSISDYTTSGASHTITIDSSNAISSADLDWWVYERHSLSISEVENMCEEYPALEKVWRNFKSVYDMVKQDYEGKKKAGKIDDNSPF